jgi:hypothetical protein
MPTSNVPSISATDWGGYEMPDDETLEEIVDHIVLPPKLPQRALDGDRALAVESGICSLAASCVRRYQKTLSDPSERDFWQRMKRSIDHLRSSTTSSLDEKSLVKLLKEMDLGGSSESFMFFLQVGTDFLTAVVALHIHEQNAAVLVRRTSNGAIFEIFEVQPATEDVIKCSGKLTRFFPGPAVAIPDTVWSDPGFLEQVSSFLTQMDTEVLDSAATTRKAGSTHQEVRESAHPRYVSQLFVGILLGYGEDAGVLRVEKRTADEVLWKSALKPCVHVYLLVDV